MYKTRNPLIFIIEDSTVYKNLIVGHLRSHKYTNVKTFKNGEECLKAMELHPDIIVLDYSFEGISGMDLMHKVKEDRPEIDFVFISAQNDVEVAVQIMRYGAADYVVKNEKAPYRLVKAIDQLVSSTKRDKIKKGFKIGVVGFFVMLFLIIVGIIFISIFFKLEM